MGICYYAYMDYTTDIEISIEFSAEVKIWCRSQQLGAEVTRVEHRLPQFGKQNFFKLLPVKYGYAKSAI